MVVAGDDRHGNSNGEDPRQTAAPPRGEGGSYAPMEDKNGSATRVF
jgi:hypothetical protein